MDATPDTLGLLLALPTKPAWVDRVHADWVAFLVAFSAMIVMHFGL